MTRSRAERLLDPVLWLVTPHIYPSHLLPLSLHWISLSPTAQTILPQSRDAFTTPSEAVPHDMLLLPPISLCHQSHFYLFCPARHPKERAHWLFKPQKCWEKQGSRFCRASGPPVPTAVVTLRGGRGEAASRCGATHIVICSQGSRSNLWRNCCLAIFSIRQCLIGIEHQSISPNNMIRFFYNFVCQ